MVVGCLLLANSTSDSPISRARLLILLGTLNVYEALLIGLAVWLIASRDLVRDGAILLGIEAFFLVDTTFLNHEIFTIDVHLGVLVSGLLMMLATFKLAAVFIGLRIFHASGALVRREPRAAGAGAGAGIWPARQARDQPGDADALAVDPAAGRGWTVGRVPQRAAVPRDTLVERFRAVDVATAARVPGLRVRVPARLVDVPPRLLRGGDRDVLRRGGPWCFGAGDLAEPPARLGRERRSGPAARAANRYALGGAVGGVVVRAAGAGGAEQHDEVAPHSLEHDGGVGRRDGSPLVQLATAGRREYVGRGSSKRRSNWRGSVDGVKREVRKNGPPPLLGCPKRRRRAAASYFLFDDPCRCVIGSTRVQLSD